MVEWCDRTRCYLAKSLHLKIHFKCLSQLIHIDPSLWPIHASKISIRGSKQTMDNICMYASMYNNTPMCFSYVLFCLRVITSYATATSNVFPTQWQPALPAQQDPGWRRRESKRRMLPEFTWETSQPNFWKNRHQRIYTCFTIVWRYICVNFTLLPQKFLLRFVVGILARFACTVKLQKTHSSKDQCIDKQVRRYIHIHLTWISTTQLPLGAFQIHS